LEQSEPSNVVWGSFCLTNHSSSIPNREGAGFFMERDAHPPAIGMSEAAMAALSRDVREIPPACLP